MVNISTNMNKMNKHLPTTIFFIFQIFERKQEFAYQPTY